MSKNSAKQNLTQLQEWLEVFKKKNNSSKGPKRFSKADHYKNKGVRNGR